MVHTHGLTHIALAVRDAERALGFYRAVFGVVAVYRQGGIIQAQTPGSRDVLVFDEHAPNPGQAGGIAHIGFRLVDPDDIALASQARGCTRAHTSTYAFQALAFYQRHGYRVIGQLDDYPDGYTLYWLRKDLESLPDDE